MHNVQRIIQLWLYIINLGVQRNIVTASMVFTLDYTLTVIWLRRTKVRGDLGLEHHNKTHMIVKEFKEFLKNCRQVLKEKNFVVEEVVKASSMLLDQTWSQTNVQLIMKHVTLSVKASQLSKIKTTFFTQQFV